MSDGSAPSSKAPVPFKRTRTLLRWVLIACLLVTVIYAVQLAVQTARTTKDADVTMVRSTGLVESADKHLAGRFHDTQGRLLADPAPTDKCIDPDTLVLAHIVPDSASDENVTIDWKAFAEHLARVTGKKVSEEVYDNTPEQHLQIANGNIHIVALHAVDAPFLVNDYGFEPLAVLGDENGAEGNHLDIIVPVASSIQKVDDLRGQTLMCTKPTSITGYRAAVVSLMQSDGLRPDVDYYISWSMKQTKAIEGVAKKQFQAAAISDDKLQSLLSKKRVDKASFRQIYQSAVIPRTTIGWFYDLKPELAAKVKEAVLSFRPSPATADMDGADVSDAMRPLHFIPIDYKKDFKFLREIDDHFDPRFGVKVKSPATTQP